jgi:hypothetical protein
MARNSYACAQSMYGAAGQFGGAAHQRGGMDAKIRLRWICVIGMMQITGWEGGTCCACRTV